MNRKFTYAILAGIISLSACKKDNVRVDENPGTTTPVNKIAPDGFTFATSKNVTLNVTLKANNDQPLAGVVVSVLMPNTSNIIFKGVTNKSGVLQGVVTVPAATSKLTIDPAYIGVMRNANASISASNTINVVIGGKDGFSGDIVPDEFNSSESKANNKYISQGWLTTDYGYPGSYTASSAFVTTAPYTRSMGRPLYLESTGDVIEPSLLSYINASLPEGSPLTTTHPEYLSNSTVSTINVTAKSDIYVTFVSEGAGYQSTLAYYTYKTNTPPTNTSGGIIVNAIDKITYVFPNASAYGSGGGLKAGDKVKLGNFDAGTTIAFVLMQDAWTGTGVYNSAQKFYSQNSLNPESSSSGKRQHAVVLYDDVHDLYLTGFEDCNRTTPSSNVNGYTTDNDFNDLVFYTTSAVTNAISNADVPAIDKGGDSDGDGVQDVQDAFPNDPTRAYISYYPSQNTYASIAFEDNWPKKGDYDMNDLVVNCRYTFTSNASNQIVDMKGEFVPLASGASFHNGFGVQLPVAASAVSAVSGQKAISNYIKFAGNGVEAGQSKAVIIPFDNHEAVMKNADNSYFINTMTDKPKVTTSTVTVNVTFASPVAQSSLQPSTFNPFLISDLRRGYEIHLPGYAPTDLVDSKLFGTDDDASSSTTKYYVSKENWPWAISFSTEFKYPVELQSINQAYPHFLEWAGSNGATYTDWYSNTAAGYRVDSKIYSK
ncbi:LruC domain-containing protein [Mucilaginibacter sp. Bleaf8]|uniref:LruC domain-containing protein n=1 Tax=Mucilaginibacter sp. Bleaf8 TaxID=2834430 RepID=UPI001BCFA9A8|nr:LruC domain-containing protein [Mucilaginibacter sp. Bleaf8]MBS7566617.1 LruC domain-containing protein [Mucilaginibacter sp. Bleaf8]